MQYDAMYHISLLNFVFANTESLDELSQLASALFSPIVNRGRDPLPLLPEHPFGPNEKGVIILIIIFCCVSHVFSRPLSLSRPLWLFMDWRYHSH